MKSAFKRISAFIAPVWGVGGVLFLLVEAIVRLSKYIYELGSIELQWYHWGLILLNVLFMGYSEGYRGFQQGFAPRVAARARYLSQHQTLITMVFAPLFCMSFFHTTRKRLIVSYTLTSGIIILILMIRTVPQPWRGIIDSGVVIGLFWGMLAILYFAIKSVVDEKFDYPAEIE